MYFLDFHRKSAKCINSCLIQRKQRNRCSPPRLPDLSSPPTLAPHTVQGAGPPGSRPSVPPPIPSVLICKGLYQWNILISFASSLKLYIAVKVVRKSNYNIFVKQFIEIKYPLKNFLISPLIWSTLSDWLQTSGVQV